MAQRIAIITDMIKNGMKLYRLKKYIYGRNNRYIKQHTTC